jgi:hypothetical protein
MKAIDMPEKAYGVCVAYLGVIVNCSYRDM